MTDLVLKERRAEWTLRKHKKVLEDMERKREGLEKSLSSMQDLLSQLQTSETEQKEDLDEWKRNTDMLQQKGQEYEERLEQLDNLYTPEMDEIRVEVIAEIEEEVRQLSKVVKEKEKTLKGFQDLPPDITLARLKLDEKKHYLQELVNRKHELLESIAGQMQ
ncbi:hypothetical protein HK097_001980 [Rhizophlyctis rosea]|uniref:Uncharacterized protein n=1 Tax=Rhizophlyctis rosea TaxID=64517 RepID=A0AAD5SGS6_9FUNG|nr:hypothetical protein HK097_001980 [Rhizophlyctis rosea]